MKNPSQNLHAVNQPRTGSAEERVAIDHPDLASQPIERRGGGPEL